MLKKKMRTLILGFFLMCIGGVFSMRLLQGMGSDNATSDNMTAMNETTINATALPDNILLSKFNNESIGEYLTDPNGMALYMFDKDHIGSNFTESDFESTCYDQCAVDWPPLLIEEAQRNNTNLGEGLQQDLLGFIDRKDGTTQLTYNHIPLYYYKMDTKPGDIHGHLITDAFGKWFLIRPDGTPIES